MLTYLELVLLPLIEEKVKNLVEVWDSVKERNMVICDWDIPVWVDEEISLGLGLRNCNIRETIYTRDMTKVLLVEVSALCFIAANTLYMLPKNTKQESVGLLYVFGKMTNIVKEDIDDICKICGQLKKNVKSLGMESF